MAGKVNAPSPPRPRVIPEMDLKMASATLRKPESDGYQAEIGRCLFAARSWLGWTLEELAAKLPPPPGSDKRDPRQVRRWESGEERTPVDVVFCVPELREPFALRIAKLAGATLTTTAAFTEGWNGQGRGRA